MKRGLMRHPGPPETPQPNKGKKALHTRRVEEVGSWQSCDLERGAKLPAAYLPYSRDAKVASLNRKRKGKQHWRSLIRLPAPPTPHAPLCGR